MYHEILSEILESLMQLQESGGIHWNFEYHGKQYSVNLKFYLLAIIGDTEGHDRMCGQFNSRSLQTQRLCCHCDLPTMDMDNPHKKWSHILQQDIANLVAD